MKNRTRKGFTLIELLAVIALMSILSVAVIALTQNARIKARDAKRIAELEQMRNAINLYLDDNHEYPPITDWVHSADLSGGIHSWTNLEAMLVPKYMARLPIDPINDVNSWPWTTGKYAYAYISNGKEYDLLTQLEDSSSPYRCEVMNWMMHASYTWGSAGSWCAPSPGPNYSKNIYADH